MSKRSYRRLAVVAGAALAVGSMAPAMAVRIDAGAGAGAEVDPAGVVTDVTAITGSLPLPELSDLPIPSYAQLNGTILGVGGLGILGVGVAGTHVNALVDNVLDHATLVAGGLGDDCALVAVASCNDGPGLAALVPVNASGVLGGDILSNNGDLGLGSVTANVVAPVIAPVHASVGNILGGGLLNGGLPGLGGLLDVDANANVLAAVFALL